MTLSSCLVWNADKKLTLSSIVKQKVDLPSSLTSVNVSNNVITINGSGFAAATVVSLKKGGIETPLTIDSKSDTQIVASAISNLALVINSSFDLIIGTAEAQATYAITFTLDNNSIDLLKLKNTGASSGYVIKYNGTNWVAAPQNETQIFQGTWDAIANLPDLAIPSSTPGDYYIVSSAGTYDTVAYAVGDWIISDGYSWQKVPVANTSVMSFQGRKGIVTLVPGDYVSLKDTGTNKVTGSKLSDIADINVSTAPTNGQVLKWNTGSSSWLPADDTGGAAGIALTDLSATAPLSYSNTTGMFSLSATNILALPLTGLASGSGAIAATDTIVGAFGKLMSVPSDYVSKASANTISGATVVSGLGASLSVPTPLITDYGFAANVQYVNDQIAVNGNWSKGASTSINYTAGNVGIGTMSPTSPLHVVDGLATLTYDNTLGLTIHTPGGGGNWTTSMTSPAPGFLKVPGLQTTVVAASGTDIAIYSGQNWTTKIDNKTMSYSSGLNVGTKFVPTINTSGTASASAVQVSPYVPAVGSGENYLFDVGTNSAAAGSGTHTSKVSIDTTGRLLLGGYAYGVSPSGFLSFGGTSTNEARIYAATDGRLMLRGASNQGTVFENSFAATGGTINGNPTPWNGSPSFSILPNYSGTLSSGIQTVTVIKPTTTGGLVNSGAYTGLAIDMSNITGVVNAATFKGGTVGIGTTTPIQPLHVLVGGARQGVMIENSGTNGRKYTLTSSNNSSSLGGGLFTIYDDTAAAARLNIDSSGNVGIGTSTPAYPLDVNGTIVTRESTLGNGVKIFTVNNSGTPVLNFQRTDNTGTLFLDTNGSFSFGKGVVINGNLALGAGGGLAINGAGSLPISSGGANPILFSTNNSERMRIDSSGSVGIGTTAPGYKLDVQGGDINASGSVRAAGVALTSDRRWKRNITPLRNSIEKMKQINGVSYDWATDEYPEKQFSIKRQVGVIAQDVQVVFPELVYPDKDGFLSVNYPALIAPLIEAFKAQQKQIEANVRMFKTMQGEIEEIKLMVAENKREIASTKAEFEIKLAIKDKEIAILKERLHKIEKMLMEK